MHPAEQTLVNHKGESKREGTLRMANTTVRTIAASRPRVATPAERRGRRRNPEKGQRMRRQQISRKCSPTTHAPNLQLWLSGRSPYKQALRETKKQIRHRRSLILPLRTNTDAQANGMRKSFENKRLEALYKGIAKGRQR